MCIVVLLSIRLYDDEEDDDDTNYSGLLDSYTVLVFNRIGNTNNYNNNVNTGNLIK